LPVASRLRIACSRCTRQASPGSKRRPRKDWLIQYDTHPALITTDEAEILLARLELGRPGTYKTKADTLLGGLLTAPDGRPWHGDGEGSYRIGKGRRLASPPEGKPAPELN